MGQGNGTDLVVGVGLYLAFFGSLSALSMRWARRCVAGRNRLLGEGLEAAGGRGSRGHHGFHTT